MHVCVAVLLFIAVLHVSTTSTAHQQQRKTSPLKEKKKKRRKEDIALVPTAALTLATKPLIVASVLLPRCPATWPLSQWGGGLGGRGGERRTAQR